MFLAYALISAGLALSFIGFSMFRQPGVPFLFLGPVWRANKFLTPPGVALWISGSVVGLIGILLMALN